MRIYTSLFTLIILTLLTDIAIACTSCNLPLQEAIFNKDFYPTLFKLTSPFLLVGGLIYIIYNKLK